MKRLLILFTTALILGSGLAHAQKSDAYPNRPLKIIITTAAGGGLDLVARTFAARLSASLGQPVIVESRPGANGMIAIAAVAKAPGDGYSILMTHGAIVQNEMRASRPYELSELAPVAMVAETSIGFAINVSTKANTLAEFLRLVQSNPKAYSYASYGQGSSGHVLGEMLKRAARVDMPHVPYKGEAPAVADLVAGHVPASFAGMGALNRQVLAGKLRILAVTGSARSSEYPDVPTFAEAGYPQVDLGALLGVFVPASTPKQITQRLSREFVRLAATQEVAAKVREYGFKPVSLDAQAFGDYMKADVQRWRTAINENNITLE